MSPRTPNHSLWERHVNLPRLARCFRVRTGRKGNNHSRQLGNILLGASGRQAPVQTAPTPTPLTQGCFSPASPLPAPKALQRAPLQGWDDHPTPSTGRGRHQHLQPGASSQPAILIMSFLVKSLNGSSLCSQDKGPRPQHSSADTAWDPPFPSLFLSHVSPTLWFQLPWL